jgi:hypothetical protein
MEVRDNSSLRKNSSASWFVVNRQTMLLMTNPLLRALRSSIEMSIENSPQTWESNKFLEYGQTGKKGGEKRILSILRVRTCILP